MGESSLETTAEGKGHTPNLTVSVQEQFQSLSVTGEMAKRQAGREQRSERSKEVE